MYTEAIHCTEAFHCSCPCIRPSVRTLRRFVAPAIVRPYVRTLIRLIAQSFSYVLVRLHVSPSKVKHIAKWCMTGLNQLAKRTFRTEWTHPRLHCNIQVALSLSAESATCLQQCPRLNTFLPYYTLKKKWIPELQVISDAYAHYKSVFSGKPEVHHISFFFFEECNPTDFKF